MPTYEYSCKLCDHRFEIFQSMKDDHLVTCPSCKEDGLRRAIGAGAGLIFKGTGFYQTDYKNNGSDKGADGGEKKESPASKDAPAKTSKSDSGGDGGSSDAGNASSEKSKS